MKIAEADILISPGYGERTDNHWQRRWARQMTTAQMIDHADVISPKKDDWVADIALAIENATRPVVLVGHSLGVIAIAHAIGRMDTGKVKGAFLVTPSDWEREGLIPGFDDHDFAPIPRQKMPFPTQLVASRTDPFCTFERASEFAAAWGATVIDAGDAAHINEASGQGPWPEGLTAFALFMKTL